MSTKPELKEACGRLVEALSEKEELLLEEAASLSGLSEEELAGVVAVLEALGLAEVEDGVLRWLGPEVRGRVIIVRGKVDYVLQNPFEVRVFGQEELRATARP